jgi:beta-mannosidase
VPRDHGAGWDFEDVRDHYLTECFGVDPTALRSSDMDRYLALSRVVTGDVMARTIAEWRRAGSGCHGALVWFFQDLWSGAGWGLLEASGRPKPAYFAVKRAMQPLAALVTDEGANGLRVHVANDGECPFVGELRALLLREGSTIVASATAPVRVAPRGVATIEADAMFGRFVDSAYAYRFGPPNHDIAAFLLTDTTGRLRSDAWHFPLGLPNDRHRDESLSASAKPVDDRTIEVVVRATRFAQSVALDLGDFIPDDNYFHMVPGGERTIVAQTANPNARFDGYVQALNGYDAVRVRMEPNAGQVASQ